MYSSMISVVFFTSFMFVYVIYLLIKIGARAAWSLSEWNEMDSFVSQLSPDNIDGSFMRTVLAVHYDHFSEASKLIDNTRRQLDANISALLAESYGNYCPLFCSRILTAE